MSSTSALAKFQHTHGYKDLIQKHNLQEKGIWHVQGEDPNCDFGGSHSNPSLGYYEGTLQDVIETAVLLDRFWQWGGGGNITKVVTKKATDEGRRARQRAELDQQIAELQKQRKQLED